MVFTGVPRPSSQAVSGPEEGSEPRDAWRRKQDHSVPEDLRVQWCGPCPLLWASFHSSSEEKSGPAKSRDWLGLDCPGPVSASEAGNGTTQGGLRRVREGHQVLPGRGTSAVGKSPRAQGGSRAAWELAGLLTTEAPTLATVHTRPHPRQSHRRPSMGIFWPERPGTKETQPAIWALGL